MTLDKGTKNSFKIKEKMNTFLKVVVGFVVGIFILFFGLCFLGYFLETLSQEQTSITSSESSKNSIEIVSIDSKVVETNSIWHRHSYVLKVRNNSDREVLFDAEIVWQDSDGFLIDTDRQYRLSIPANSENTYTGMQLIKTDSSVNVRGVSAKINRR